MSLENFEVQYEKLRNKYIDQDEITNQLFIQFMTKFKSHCNLNDDQIGGLWHILANENKTFPAVKLFDLLDMLKVQSYGDSDDEDANAEDSQSAGKINHKNVNFGGNIEQGILLNHLESIFQNAFKETSTEMVTLYDIAQFVIDFIPQKDQAEVLLVLDNLNPESDQVKRNEMVELIEELQDNILNNSSHGSDYLNLSSEKKMAIDSTGLSHSFENNLDFKDSFLSGLDNSSEDISGEEDIYLNTKVEMPDIDEIDESTANPYQNVFEKILEKYRGRFEKFGMKLENLESKDENLIGSKSVKKHIKTLDRILRYFDKSIDAIYTIQESLKSACIDSRQQATSHNELLDKYSKLDSKQLKQDKIYEDNLKNTKYDLEQNYKELADKMEQKFTQQEMEFEITISELKQLNDSQKNKILDNQSEITTLNHRLQEVLSLISTNEASANQNEKTEYDATLASADKKTIEIRDLQIKELMMDLEKIKNEVLQLQSEAQDDKKHIFELLNELEHLRRDIPDENASEDKTQPTKDIKDDCNMNTQNTPTKSPAPPTENKTVQTPIIQLSSTTQLYLTIEPVILPTQISPPEPVVEIEQAQIVESSPEILPTEEDNIPDAIQQLIDLKLELAKVRERLSIKEIKYKAYKKELKAIRPDIVKKLNNSFKNKNISKRKMNIEENSKLKGFMEQNLKKNKSKKQAIPVKNADKINSILDMTRQRKNTLALSKTQNASISQPKSSQSTYDYLGIKNIDPKLTQLLEKETGGKIGDEIYSDFMTRVGTNMKRKLRYLVIIGKSFM